MSLLNKLLKINESNQFIAIPGPDESDAHKAHLHLVKHGFSHLSNHDSEHGTTSEYAKQEPEKMRHHIVKLHHDSAGKVYYIKHEKHHYGMSGLSEVM